MTETDEQHYPRLSSFRVGLAGRCPRCGEGRLFAGYLRVRESCAACGLDFRHHDSGDGPAALIILVLGFVVVGLAGWLEIKLQPPLWFHAILWIPAVLLGTLALLRPLKGWLIAQQYRHRSGDRGDRGWQ